MKANILLTITSSLIILSATSFEGMAQWISQNSTTSVSLQSASFVDSLTGWVVGDSGIVLHTIDGGNIWHRQASHVLTTLYSVSFSDTANGWATGIMGMILRTSDGGNNWIRVMHDTLASIRNFKVECLSPTTAVVLRDSFTGDFYQNTKIWKTTDGGAIWSDISPYSGHFSFIKDMFFISRDSGWACGVGGSPHGYQFHQTTNGGISWKTNEFNSPTLWAMQRIFFQNALQGWATDWDSVYHTSDGGISWNSVSNPQFNDLTDFVMLGNIGYVSRTWGKIKKTTDGGVTWIEQISAPANFITDIEFVTPNVGWAVGWNGQIVHTANGDVASVSHSSNIPESYSLSQNYPNPFNPTTRIMFTVPHQTYVSIVVYDILGRQIEKLVEREFSAGPHEVEWKSENTSGGIYFYQMVADRFSNTKKLILVK